MQGVWQEIRKSKIRNPEIHFGNPGNPIFRNPKFQTSSQAHPREVWDLRFVDSKLLLMQREWIFNIFIIKIFIHDFKFAFLPSHLCYFEELRHPVHPYQELLVQVWRGEGGEEEERRRRGGEEEERRRVGEGKRRGRLV